MDSTVLEPPTTAPIICRQHANQLMFERLEQLKPVGKKVFEDHVNKYKHTKFNDWHDTQSATAHKNQCKQRLDDARLCLDMAFKQGHCKILCADTVAFSSVFADEPLCVCDLCSRSLQQQSAAAKDPSNPYEGTVVLSKCLCGRVTRICANCCLCLLTAFNTVESRRWSFFNINKSKWEALMTNKCCFFTLYRFRTTGNKSPGARDLQTSCDLFEYEIAVCTAYLDLQQKRTSTLLALSPRTIAVLPDRNKSRNNVVVCKHLAPSIETTSAKSKLFANLRAYETAPINRVNNTYREKSIKFTFAGALERIKHASEELAACKNLLSYLSSPELEQTDLLVKVPIDIFFNVYERVMDLDFSSRPAAQLCDCCARVPGEFQYWNAMVVASCPCGHVTSACDLCLASRLKDYSDEEVKATDDNKWNFVKSRPCCLYLLRMFCEDKRSRLIESELARDHELLEDEIKLAQMMVTLFKKREEVCAKNNNGSP
jgi:hypothetical protein